MADNITKAELLTEVSQISGVSKVDAEKVLDAFFDRATLAAYGSGQVSWPGFGSFKGARRKPRTARNLHTGESMQVPAKTVMKFTQSSTLKEKLNGTKAPAIPKAAKKRPAAKKATTTSAKKATKTTKKSPRKSAKKATKKTAKKSARGRKR